MLILIVVNIRMGNFGLDGGLLVLWIDGVESDEISRAICGNSEFKGFVGVIDWHH